MPYTPQTWVDGLAGNTPLSAARLNHMEAGITGASIVFNVQTYGAVGNGSTDDTAAIQSAIDAAFAADGGVVTFDSQTYRLTGTLILKDHVHLVGAGQQATFLSWASDLGVDTYAIDHPVSPGIQSDAPSVSSLSVRGPGGYVLGSRTSEMNGIRLGPNVAMTDVTVTQFGGGVVFQYDHNVLTRCKVSANYYNLYWKDDPAGTGNQAFYSCVFDGASYACVAVEGTNVINDSIFIGGHCGFSPYGFIKLDGPTSGVSQLGLLASSTLIHLSFESIGNAAIADFSTGGTTGTDTLFKSRIESSGFSWDPAYELSGGIHDQNFAIKARSVTDTFLRMASYPFTAGDVGVIYTTNSAGFHIFCSAVPANLFGNGTINAQLGPAPPTVDIGTAHGIAQFAAGTISEGDILGHRGTYATVNRYAWAFGADEYGDLYAYAGVAATSAVDTQIVVVWKSGIVSVLCEPITWSGEVIAPLPGTLHHGTPQQGRGGISGGTPNGYPGIGVSVTNGTGGGGGALAPVELYAFGRDPGFYLPGAVSAFPTAGVAYRGQILRINGGAGVIDQVKVCIKQADDSYAWVTLI